MLLAASALVACGRFGFDPRAEPPDAAPDAAPVCGPEVDLQSDPANCGTCGHDCLGGGCADGACKPVELATAQGALRGIVVDATHVYWAGPGAIRRVKKTGSAPEDVATFTGTGFRMIEHAGWLYWVTRDTGIVARAPMGANGAPAQILALDQGDVGGVATDGTLVYWNNYPTGGKIYRALIGATQFSEVLTTPTDGLTGMRLVGSELYYLQLGSGLMRISIAGGSPTTVAPGVGSWELAIDGDDVFVTNQASDAIVKVSLSGAVPPVTVAECLDPWGIAVDVTHVYYANERTAAGSIARAPRTGGMMEVLAPSVLPVGIAVDATAVYWTTLGGGVFKLAK
jgi:hypothetical protein